MSSAPAGEDIPKGFQLPFLHTVEGWSHGKDGFHVTFKALLTTSLVVLVLFFILAPQQSINNFEMVFFLAPIWLPIILYKSVHARFGQMAKAKFLSEQQYVLLELRIPRDTTKTPFAMETVLANLHVGSGETNWYKRYFQGGMRPSWSFEIVSLGGRLHLYVWTRVGYRRLVESYFYAQYPDIEIIEAEDYSRLVDPSEHGYGMFACEFGLSTSVSNVYPIKTYVDYGMEPGDKPEETVDPLGQLLETIGNIGPQEQFWIQIIFRQKKEEKYEGLVNNKGKKYSWNDEVQEAIEAIRSQTVRKTMRIDPVTGAVTESETFPNPTKGQSEGMAAVERKANKQIFDVGIRAIYLAPDEAFQGIMIPAMLTMFKPFNNERGNAISPIGRWSAFFNDFPWEDRGGHHKHHLHHQVIPIYRRREYFTSPYKGPWSNMSTEEIATLFHIPSAAVTTPNLERIQSATSSAPSNLPS